MQPHEHHSLAPDPVTEPEKCAGIRAGFMFIAGLGLAVFLCTILSLYTPSIYSALKSATEVIWPSPAADPLALHHDTSVPIISN